MFDSSETSILPGLLAFPIPSPLAEPLARITGIRKLQAVYAALRAMRSALSLPARLLDHLEVTHRVAENDLHHIPRTGPAVLVVNHPFGMLEGAVLAAMLSAIRPDVKLLANGILAAVPELRDLVIPVDPMGGANASRSNPGGLRQSLRFLANGGLLVVFPAGEVSHFQWRERGITDPPWDQRVARLVEMAARRTPALCVIPAYVAGANSMIFHALGLLHPRLRTALLIRELLNKRRAHVEVRLGSAIAAEKLLAIPTAAEKVRYLRWRTYLLASRQEFKARTSRPLARAGERTPHPLAAAMDAGAMSAEVLALPPASLLAHSGELSAYIAPAAAIPAVLAEIGRLREVTFRAAGEGTGKATDVDEFDSHYLHLFLWNHRRQEVAGAYRLAGTDQVPRLYTATLFAYGAAFLDRLGPALELGRSFVRAEYQRGFAPLLLLWKGIGKYVARHPRYRILFGPVSISNQYQAASRELMVAFLERHASLRDWVGLVAARNPFRRPAKARLPEAGIDVEELSAAVSDIEPGRAGVPVLLRQYLKLGGRLLGFHVDPQFANALDGLILVDLTRTEPRLLERYLGKAEAAEFLAFQKGRHAAQ